MFTSIQSACIDGIGCIPVNVETSASTGLPQETIIGLADTVVKESRSRIKSAIQLSDFNLPAMAYVINLTPTDIAKRNTSLELAMCVALLHVTQQITIQPNQCFIGSLSLDGRILPVRHILPMVYHYPNRDNTTFIIPNDNMADLAPISDIKTIPIGHLKDFHRFTQLEEKKPTPIAPAPHALSTSYNHIHGHHATKKACTYAIIGRHPMLLIGSPGIGKTMLIDHMASIIPPLGTNKAIENTCIESLIHPNPSFSAAAPFRAPHHSITYAGMLGGKNPPLPGEITRANHGILFLDELGEYHRSILDMLREPMETQCIRISRAGHSLSYPANFLLIAAMNPCHCGHYFDTYIACQCHPKKIKQYWQKLSRPLLDRISMICLLSKPHKTQPSISHSDMCQMVSTGMARSSIRNPNACPNNALNQKEFHDVSTVSTAAQQAFHAHFEATHASLRAQLRVMKLSLTIADACDSAVIELQHALESIQLSQHHLLPS